MIRLEPRLKHLFDRGRLKIFIWVVCGGGEGGGKGDIFCLPPYNSNNRKFEYNLTVTSSLEDLEFTFTDLILWNQSSDICKLT